MPFERPRQTNSSLAPWPLTWPLTNEVTLAVLPEHKFCINFICASWTHFAVWATALSNHQCKCSWCLFWQPFYLLDPAYNWCASKCLNDKVLFGGTGKQCINLLYQMNSAMHIYWNTNNLQIINQNAGREKEEEEYISVLTIFPYFFSLYKSILNNFVWNNPQGTWSVTLDCKSRLFA